MCQVLSGLHNQCCLRHTQQQSSNCAGAGPAHHRSLRHIQPARAGATGLRRVVPAPHAAVLQ